MSLLAAILTKMKVDPLLLQRVRQNDPTLTKLEWVKFRISILFCFLLSKRGIAGTAGSLFCFSGGVGGPSRRISNFHFYLLSRCQHCLADSEAKALAPTMHGRWPRRSRPTRRSKKSSEFMVQEPRPSVSCGLRLESHRREKRAGLTDLNGNE